MKRHNTTNNDLSNIERDRNELRSRYTSLLESIREVVFLLNDEVIVECNSQASRLLGYENSEIIGAKPWAFAPEFQQNGLSSREYAKINISKAASGSYHLGDWIAQKKDGSLLETEIILSPVEYDGRPHVQVVFLDISEYRTAREKLKERDEQFRAVFDSIFEMVMVYDADGSIVDANMATLRGLGYTKAELLELRAEDFIHPDSMRHYDRFVKEVLQGHRYIGAALCYKKNGELMELEVSGAPFIYQGEPAMMAMARDVTAQKNTERALRTSEARLSLALEAGNDGIWDWHMSSGSTYFSPQYYRMAGYEPDEFPANFDEWAKRVHPDDYDASYRDIHRHVDGEKGQYQTEFRFLSKNGAWMWINARGKVVEWDDDGNPVRMIGIHTDITDKKNAERALLESERRFRTIIDQSADMFFMCDKDTGSIIDVNRYACIKTGYSREELLSMNVAEVEKDYTTEFLTNDIWIGLKKGERLTVTGQHRKKDGTFYPVEIRMSMIDIGDAEYIIGLARDITDRMRDRRALEESNTMLRLVLDTIPVGVYWKDLEGHYLGCNSVFARSAGFESSNEIIGKTDHDMIWRKYAEGRSASDKKVIESDEALINAVREGETLSGEKRVISESKVPLKDYEGNTIGVLGSHQDITEEVEARRKTEETHAELVRRNRMMEGLLSAIPHPVFYKDLEGRYIGCNKAFSEWTGKSSEELYGNSVLDFWSFKEAQENYDTDLIIMKEEKTVVYESVAWDKDDVFHDVIMGKSIFRDENGEVAGLVGMFSDITELKKAQNELKQSRSMLDSIITSVPDIIYRLDTNGIITFISSKVCDYGFTPETLTGKNMFDLIHPDEAGEIREMFFARRENDNNRTVSYEAHMKLMDSALRSKEKWPVFYVTSKSLFDTNEDGDRVFAGTQCIARDITEQKRLQDQLAQSQKMESIGRLAGGVAHDFNNLLTVIAGNAQVALMSVSRENELYEYIAEIDRTSSRAADLTRQLLAFSRKQVVEPKLLDLNETIQDMENMFGRLVDENIDLSFCFADGLWTVKIDPGQVQQILTNLVVNARDAMPDGGRLTIETQNVMLSEEYTRYFSDFMAGEYVMFSVDDTGTGMDEETKSHVFEPFFTTKEKGKGTGLGMSTCYGIVRQNNGYILIYSEKGHGTSVKVYLPKTVDSAVQEKPVHSSVDLPGGTETVLVVEDEPGVRKMTVGILRRYGYVVIGASNGESALAKIDETGVKPDLVITDVIMPRMGGKMLYDHLMERYGDMRVLFMSGYTDESIVHHGVLEPGIEFIEKPFAPDMLLKKIRVVLDS